MNTCKLRIMGRLEHGKEDRVSTMSLARSLGSSTFYRLSDMERALLAQGASSRRSIPLFEWDANFSRKHEAESMFRRQLSALAAKKSWMKRMTTHRSFPSESMYRELRISQVIRLKATNCIFSTTERQREVGVEICLAGLIGMHCLAFYRVQKDRLLLFNSLRSTRKKWAETAKQVRE